MPMAYCGTRIPENSCGVKVPFRVLWRRRLATKKVTAYRRYLARKAREQRALDDFGRRLEAAHATQKDMLHLFAECRVRFHLISAPRPRATHTRAPRPRATRRARTVAVAASPGPGEDGSSSDPDSPPPHAPGWGLLPRTPRPTFPSHTAVGAIPGGSRCCWLMPKRRP